MKDEVIGISQEKFKVLKARYTEFTEKLSDMTSPPVKVYDELPKHVMEELYLIREASKGLQLKKDEDLKKAAQAAEEAASAAKEAAEKRSAEEKPKTDETEAEKQK